MWRVMRGLLTGSNKGKVVELPEFVTKRFPGTSVLLSSGCSENQPYFLHESKVYFADP